MFISLIIYSEFGTFPRVSYDSYYDGFHFDDGAGQSAFYAMTQAISILVDFTPLVGNAKGFLEGVIGGDLLTGDPYSPVERFLGLVLLTELRGAKKGLEAIGAAIDAVGGLSKIGRKGKNRGIREVVGGKSDAKELFDYLRGDNKFIEEKPGVFVAPSKDKDGVSITYRPVSDSGEPTVEAHGLEKGLRKIKFVQE